MGQYHTCPGCAGLYGSSEEVARCLASECAKDADGLPFFNGEGDPDNIDREEA